MSTIDYNFGKNEEVKVLSKIREHFGDENIKECIDQYSKFDFISDNYLYELKSRRNKYDQYPTTLIAIDKIIKDKNMIFLFNFTDGLFYIKYDKELFDKYQKKYFRRTDRGFDISKIYIFIPIEDLTEII